MSDVIDRIIKWATEVRDNDGRLTADSSAHLDMALDELEGAVREWLPATDNLAKLLELQRMRQETSFGVDLEGMTTEERVAFLHWNVTAMQAELFEAMDETSWKPWTSGPAFINREAFVGELVDALHFLNNLFLVVGADSEEITFRYLEKSSINAARQAAGYDGKDKCPVCKRALDDPAVTCGGITNRCWQIPGQPIDWPAEANR